MKDCFVSVIVPFEGAPSLLDGFIGKLSDILSTQYSDHEVIIIGEGNALHGNLEKLLDKYPCIRYLGINASADVEVKIVAGLETAIGDYVVVMSSESDPIELVTDFITLCRKGHDLVYGIRNPDTHVPFLTRQFRRAFSWFCKRFLEVKWDYLVMHFRCMSRQLVNSLVQMQDRGRSLRTDSLRLATNPVSVTYTPLSEHSLNREKSFFENIRYGLTIITQNSYHPLRLATWIGIGAIMFNAVCIFYILSVWLFKKNIVEGWASSSLLLVGHFLFFSFILTIISEYMGTVLNRLQHQPLYTVVVEQSSKVRFVSEEMKNVVNESLLPEEFRGS